MLMVSGIDLSKKSRAFFTELLYTADLSRLVKWNKNNIKIQAILETKYVLKGSF